MNKTAVVVRCFVPDKKADVRQILLQSVQLYLNRILDTSMVGGEL